jgi:AraC-like DNA-binding protein
VSERLNRNNEFDVLGDVLETLRLRGSIFFHSELAAPWGMSLTQVGYPRFHIALSGDCFVGADDEGVVKFRQCEIVMVPSGDSHWIADQPGRELISSKRAGEACELGDPLFQRGEITNCLMCGIVHYDRASSHPILDSLPKFLHFSQLKPTEPIWMTVTLIDAEIRRTQVREGSIIDRLSEVLFLQLLDHHVNNNEGVTGFFAALRDRRVREALALIHRKPNYNWSLSSLGERVGMSRATLVRRFQDAVGIPPMSYISNWRMMKAYNLIKYSNATIENVAESTGFGSARTLNKAFQRRYNCTPNEFRRAQIY